jgi:hypothetical protein
VEGDQGEPSPRPGHDPPFWSPPTRLDVVAVASHVDFTFLTVIKFNFSKFKPTIPSAYWRTPTSALGLLYRRAKRHFQGFRIIQDQTKTIKRRGFLNYVFTRNSFLSIKTQPLFAITVCATSWLLRSGGHFLSRRCTIARAIQCCYSLFILPS